MYLHQIVYLFCSFAFVAMSLLEVYLGQEWLGLAFMGLAYLAGFRLDRLEREYKRRVELAKFEKMMARKLSQF